MSRKEPNGPLPEPGRANDQIIDRCRKEIESSVKSLLRALMVPVIKRFYKLAELGEGFQWPRNFNMKLASGSKVGRFAYLGAGFESQGQVVVSDLCMVSAECRVVGADHLYNVAGTPTRLAFPTEPRKVTTFGVDAWIGARTIIVEGISIGAGAIVGSGSVVTRDVSPYTIVAGVPAKLIRARFNDPTEQAAHIRAVEKALAGAHE